MTPDLAQDPALHFSDGYFSIVKTLAGPPRF